MINVENIDVWGFEHALRGMRNPMNSWNRSDTMYVKCGSRNKITGESKEAVVDCVIGENDMGLMQRLYVAGEPHRKYLRQIMVSMDITAPLYWWKEFDTYKVGTTTNSCSTMHKITAKEFKVSDFAFGELPCIRKGCFVDPANGNQYKEPCTFAEMIVDQLNSYRNLYLATKDKKWWWAIIQTLPSSYYQKRTVTMNYENAVNMLEYRQNHKLNEWNDFCKILKDLPYMREIIDEH